MTILFWLYKSKENKKGEIPVYVRVTIQGEREQFSTQISIPASSWNQTKQRIRGRSEQSNTINQLLDKVEADLYKVYGELCNIFNDVTAKDVRQNYLDETEPKKGIIEVYDIHNERIHSLIGKDYVDRTWFNFERNKKLLAEFIKHKFNRNDMKLDRLRRVFMEDFIYFLKSVKEHNPNTIYKHVQRVNKIVNFAVAHDYTRRNPFTDVKVKKQYNEISYLSADDLLRLESKVFHVKRLEVVRDLFLFQCYTGLAYQELRNLSHANIQKGIDGYLWIVARRQKTGRMFKAPLLPKAIDILNRYKEHVLDLNMKVFPVSANSNMNAYLKEVGDLCGIAVPLTTHIGRKTFATTVTLLNGVPITTVARLLGHQDTKVTEQVYAKVVDEKLSRDVDDLRRKLGS